jgi:hypothetical protein
MAFVHNWQKTLIRIASNPMVEAIVVVAAIILSIYILIETDPIARTPHMPVLFGAH